MKTVFILMFILVTFNACKKEEKVLVINDAIDQKKTTIVSTGVFTDNGTSHNLSGRASILKDSTGNSLLRFEDFSVINGPDVNVYLSKTASFQNVIDLGDLKGTKGNINYDFDDSINTDEYKFVLVWCKEFASLFGSAELKK